MTVEKLSASLARIPWNKGLKTLCWKVGQSFLKFSGQDECFYGGLYLKRKAFEVAQNEAGAFSDQAARIIATKKFKAKPREDVGEAAEEDFKRAVEWYRQGKLPPAHLEARAERWTVKVFLAHFHQVAFFCAYGEVPPKPWILDIGGHDKEIKCPNWALVLNQRDG